MEPDIRYWIDQGKEFFKSKAYKKAETIFLKIIASRYEFADIYNMLGIIYHQTGQFNDAIASFKKALSINLNYTEAMLNLSVLYNDMGEYKLSRELVNKFKKEAKRTKSDIDPYVKGKLANKHAEVGDLYRGAGLYGKAAQEYSKALELAAHFHDIRNKLGICLREEGKKEAALKEFQRIIKEKPEYVDASIQQGITLYTLNKKEEARKIWKKLAATYPQHQLVKTYLRLTQEQEKTQLKKASKVKK